MKQPKYFVESIQSAIDLHLNGFALQLMAESFVDKPELFGDENVVLLARDHKGREVWFVMSKQRPKTEDFEPETHQQRHILLHSMFDELLADYLAHAPHGQGTERTSIHDSLHTLMLWSAKQMKEPDHAEKS